ncbi:MAG TPA: epoxyqueuosine reductase, partial [Myxococcota bacterium]|nr:epoxyqueuosine reductase [Myxococcota bacterium]
MPNLDLKNTLKSNALLLGFDDVGFARADDYTPFAKEMHDAYKEGRFGPLDYLERTLSQRADIKAQFP